MSHLRGRQVQPEDFHQFDYVLAMDRENLANLKRLKPADFQGHLGLFLLFGDQQSHDEVPDPYFGGAEGFELVLDLIESASVGLLQHIQSRLC
jgi:protein-tyrosine phosphatase